ISSQSRWQDHSDPARIANHTECQFGKKCVGVDLAAGGQIETARRSGKLISVLEAASVCLIFRKSSWVSVFERRDGTLTCCSRKFRNFGEALGKILLLAQLHLLPRRIAKYHVEAASPHDIGKFQRPVE